MESNKKIHVTTKLFVLFVMIRGQFAIFQGLSFFLVLHFLAQNLIVTDLRIALVPQSQIFVDARLLSKHMELIL